MSDRVLAWSALASLGAHVVGAGAIAALGPGGTPPAVVTVPVEIVTVAPPPAPIPPPVTRTPEVIRPLTPPRLVDHPSVQIAPSLPSEESLLEPPAPRPGLVGGFAGPARRPAVGTAVLPELGPRAGRGPALSVPRGVRDDLLPVPRTGWGVLVEADTGGNRGGAAAPGAPRLAGAGSGGGPPGPGPGGGAGAGPGAGANGRGAGGAAPDGSLTGFARPLGGYQTKPRYPESALRAGIQGVTRLRFEVLVTGAVGRVVVEESAGFVDLDRAAIDAVKTWRFEPARRGEQPVTVWVTLPVRFELEHR